MPLSRSLAAPNKSLTAKSIQPPKTQDFGLLESWRNRIEVTGMSAKEEFHEPKSEWSALVQPLDEAIWDKWVAEDEARNRHQRVMALKTLASGCAAALFVAAVFWSRFSPP